MRFEPDPDRLLWAMILTAALGFAMALVGLVGEVLGWWNDTGEVLVTVGTILGLVISFGAGVYSASRQQVAGVRAAVLDNGVKLTSVDGRLTSVDDKLTSVDRKLDKLDDLDRIQLQLDRQTGVLGDQVELLTEIRDRL